MNKLVVVSYVASHGEGSFSFKLEDVSPEALPANSQEESVHRLMERLARNIVRGGVTKVTVEVSDE